MPHLHSCHFFLYCTLFPPYFLVFFCFSVFLYTFRTFRRSPSQPIFTPLPVHRPLHLIFIFFLPQWISSNPPNHFDLSPLLVKTPVFEGHGHKRLCFISSPTDPWFSNRWSLTPSTPFPLLLGCPQFLDEHFPLNGPPQGLYHSQPVPFKKFGKFVNEGSTLAPLSHVLAFLPCSSPFGTSPPPAPTESSWHPIPTRIPLLCWMAGPHHSLWPHPLSSYPSASRFPQNFSPLSV